MKKRRTPYQRSPKNEAKRLRGDREVRVPDRESKVWSPIGDLAHDVERGLVEAGALASAVLRGGGDDHE